MSAETIALITTTLGAIAAAVKAIAEARKARYEREKAALETARANAEASRAAEAEEATRAVIEGVEKATQTIDQEDISRYLKDEICSVATKRGVEQRLNTMVKKVKETAVLDRTELLRKLES